MLIDLGAMRDDRHRPGPPDRLRPGRRDRRRVHGGRRRSTGFATPFGDTGSVGLGGLTLGGGIGWLARKHGLTIDSLVEVDLVTADGRLVTVSEAADPDLFWAIRGGGGNFGIATRFRYRLHPVDMVTGGMLVLPLTHQVLRDLVDASVAAPEELTQITFVMGLPPAPFVPPEAVGMPAVLVMPVHAGPLEDGTAAMAPFRAIATPLADMVGPMPYPAMYQLTAGGEQPGPGVVRSAFMPDLDDDGDRRDRRAPPEPAGRPGDDPAAGPRRRRWPACPPAPRRSPIATRRSWPRSSPTARRRTRTLKAYAESYLADLSGQCDRRVLELPRRGGRRAGSTRPTRARPTSGSSR